MNSNHRTICDQLRNDAERNSIIWIIKRRHQHRRVCDVKVRITRRQALSMEYQRLGHWDRDRIYFGSIFQPHRFKTIEVFLKHGVVGIGRIFLFADHNGRRINKAAQIVNVTMGVVTFYPSVEPQNVCDSQVVADNGFEIFAREARVSNLYILIEQAFFCGYERAPAVDIDSTTFKHNITIAEPSAKDLQTERARGLFRHRIIILPIFVFCPRVEAKTDYRGLRTFLVFFDKDWTEVTRRPSIRRKAKELATIELNICFEENFTRGGLVLF